MRKRRLLLCPLWHTQRTQAVRRTAQQKRESMKHKYFWWLAPNGMIGQYRKSPGDDWHGPYDNVRDLKAAQHSVHPTLLHAGCGGEIVQTKPYCKKCRVVEPQSG